MDSRFKRLYILKKFKYSYPEINWYSPKMIYSKRPPTLLRWRHYSTSRIHKQPLRGHKPDWHTGTAYVTAPRPIPAPLSHPSPQSPWRHGHSCPHQGRLYTRPRGLNTYFFFFFYIQKALLMFVFLINKK